MKKTVQEEGKRVVLVTGASHGIGEAIALEFARCGDIVVVNYNSSASGAEAVVELVRSAGGKGLAIKADVSKFPEVNVMLEEVVTRFGRIDVIVNNAGITRTGFLMLLEEEGWDDVINTNLKGVFNTCKAAMPFLIDQRAGVIVNVSSLSGIIGLAGETPYSASKGGVIAFTRAFSKEVARFGIRVNAVAPGVIETEMTESLADADKEKFRRDIPMGRFGSPAEVASVVGFLASAGAGYITGETIVISGGLP